MLTQQSSAAAPEQAAATQTRSLDDLIAYFEGDWVPLRDAKVSIMTHAFMYGTATFEGIRGYWNEEQGQLYGLFVREHMERIRNSAKMLLMENLPTVDELVSIVVETARRNAFREDIYIRPSYYKSTRAIGVRLHHLDHELYVITTPFGNYIDIEKGVRIMTSTWRRNADEALPARGKIVGGYVNMAFQKSEAELNGFDEALVLTPGGHASEASAANLFVVRDGVLLTPPVSDDILEGVTRKAIVQLAPGCRDPGRGPLDRSLRALRLRRGLPVRDRRPGERGDRGRPSPRRRRRDRPRLAAGQRALLRRGARQPARVPELADADRLTPADRSADGREPIDAGRPTRGVHLPHRGSSRLPRAAARRPRPGRRSSWRPVGRRSTPPASPGGSSGPGTAVAVLAVAPPDGRIDIGGGRHLDISCRGSGSPVVVLDAGLGNEMDVWSAVTMRVAEFTTVCAYNRAGLGTSDLRPPPHGAASAVDDLHALLGAAGLPAPYVLVGASFGGLDAQLYARRYPDETAGVVLVDAIAPEWDRKLEAMLSPALVAERRAIPNGEDLTNEDIRASELGLLERPAVPAGPARRAPARSPVRDGPGLADRRGRVAVDVAPGGAGRDEPAVGPAPRRDEQPPDPPGPARPRRRRDPRRRGPGSLAAGRR